MIKPDKICAYPIPHDDAGGSLHLFGNVRAPHLVIMCAGYADDQTVFYPLASRIATECHCLVGVICLPGYDETSFRDGKTWKDGYRFIEWVSCLRDAVKALRQHSVVKEAKLTGIFHDWGCLAGCMYVNQAISDDKKELIPDQIVLFDGLLDPHPDEINRPKVIVPKLQQVYIGFKVFSYQILFASAFGLQRYVSTYVGAVYLVVGVIVLQALRMFPMNSHDYGHLKSVYRRRLLHSTYMAYPYFNLWKAIFTGKIHNEILGAHMPLDLARTPILFLYGDNKSVPIHSLDSVALLEKEDQVGNRSKVICFKSAGHWLYLQEADACFEHVKMFLSGLVQPTRL